MTVNLISSLVTSIIGQAVDAAPAKEEQAAAILKKLTERLAFREDASIDLALLESMGFAPTLGYASATPPEIPVEMKKLEDIGLQMTSELEHELVVNSVKAINALIRRNEDYLSGLDVRMSKLESRIAEQEGRISGAIANMDGLQGAELEKKEREVQEFHREVGRLEKELNNLTICERLANMQIVAGINSISVWVEKLGISVAPESEFSNATLEIRRKWKDEAIQTYSFLTSAKIDGAATRAGGYKNIDRFMTGFGDPNTYSHSERMEFIEEEYQAQLKKTLKEKTIPEFIELERVAAIAGIPSDKLDSELKKIYPELVDKYLEMVGEAIKRKNYESATMSIAKAVSISKKISRDVAVEELYERIIKGEIEDFAEHARYAQHNSENRFQTSPRWVPAKNATIDDRVATIGFMRAAGSALNSFAISSESRRRLSNLFAESGTSVISEALMNAKSRGDDSVGMCVVAAGDRLLSCGEYFLYSFAEELIKVSQSSEGIPDFDPTGSFMRSVQSSLFGVTR